MTNKLLSLVFVCFCIMTSCVQPQKTFPVNEIEQSLLVENEIHEINLESQFESTDEKMRLSDAVCEVEYINLETTDQSLLPPILRVEVFDENIFVSEKILESVYMFSRKGEFIHKLGRIGQGPGEYVLGRSFSCNDSLIFIQTNWLGKIRVYNWRDNTYKNDILNTEQVGDVYTLSNNTVCALFGGVLVDYVFTALVMTNQGDTISYLRPDLDIESLKKISKNALANGTCAWQTKETLNVYEFNNDTIYKITSSGIFPRYILNLGKFKMPEITFYNHKIRFKEEPNYFTVRSFTESKDFLYIYFNYKKQDWYAQYDKMNGKTKFWQLRCDPDYGSGFYNDIDGGPLVYFRHIKGDYLWRTIDYELAKDYLTKEHFSSMEAKFPEKQAELIKLIGGLKEDDNPILAIYKLK